eukprot:sb/3466267/
MLILLLSSLLPDLISSLVCTSLRGDRPWYLLLKPPHVTDAYYADSAAPFLKPYQVGIDSYMSPPAMTMRDVYWPGSNGSTGVHYLMYNDEVPGGQKSFDHGHTKGTLMFDNETIVYLVHSVPHYTYNRSADYGYPHSGVHYGQHVLCMTLPIEMLGKLAYQIRMMWPFVYEWKIPGDILTQFPDLQGIVDNVPLDSTSNPTSSVLPLSLVDGTEVLGFSKSGDFGADIYDALIAPHYSPPLSLYTETWQNGHAKLHSNCTDGSYFVKNVVHMKFWTLGLDYKETLDHSKWAICGDGSRPVVCFGGVNRMASQFKRGGGMFCFENYLLYEYLYAGVGEVEECKEDNKM